MSRSLWMGRGAGEGSGALPRPLSGSPAFSNRVSIYSFLLSVLVILVHAVNLSENGAVLSESAFWGRLTIPGYIEDFFTNTLGQVAVPGFFLLSGYLFFRTLHGPDGIPGKLSRRLKSLLVPYLLWNSLHYLARLLTGNASLSLTECIEAVFLYRYNSVFWYLFQLLLLSGLAPLLYVILHTPWLRGLFPAITLAAIYNSFDIPYLNEDALFYYYLGAFFACRGRAFFEQGRFGFCMKGSGLQIQPGSSHLSEWVNAALSSDKAKRLRDKTAHLSEWGFAAPDSDKAKRDKTDLPCGHGQWIINPVAAALFLFLFIAAEFMKRRALLGGMPSFATILVVISRSAGALSCWFLLGCFPLPEARPYMKVNFFLYALHYPLVRAAAKLLAFAGFAPQDAAACPWKEWFLLLPYFLLPPLCVLAASKGASLLKRHCAILWRLLNGGR